jgi:polyribonucleotide nucleotidyltransferase
MGSVCASTMSLLSAGVPLKAPVAGIAMGLISDEVDGKTQYVTLTDILGAEDAYGDMDFKVAGTREFVTALQLDTKLDGIPSDVLAGALQQAHDARFVILDVMADAIASPAGMSEYAPRVTTIRIPVDKIGMVIGPKGQTINAIQDETGAEISIEDDGTIYVGATDGPSADAAVERINAIANPTMPKVGDRFLGTVVKTAAFGAFVSLLPGRDGLLHISKVGNGKRVERVEDFLNVGDKVEVQIADIDSRGKIYLDKVRAEGEEAPAAEGGERPHGGGRDRDRDRGPRDRGDRDRERSYGDRGPGRDRSREPGDRGPSRDASERGPRDSDHGGERGGDPGEGGEPRRRRHRHQ